MSRPLARPAGRVMVRLLRGAARLSANAAWRAAFAYAALAVVLTWPLARGLGRDLASDLGDPLLNTWIVAWGADHLRRAVSGDLAALRDFWNANIFHPEPLALAYSEALIPQAIQVLPVYALTGNPILCYNLLFLSTFVLSGLGTFLLVRQVTGDARAGFVAGLLYAFAPYRVSQFPHLQVLSSQWMPFVLYGFRRYFDTGRPRALSGAGLALWTQNLSCGYYLFFFAPCLAVYLAYEVLSRGRARARLAVLAVGATLVAAYGASAALVTPYFELGARGLERGLEEILYYSADVYSYLTTHEAVRLWGAIARVFPKPEGDLFPGATPVLLSLLAVGLWAPGTWRHAVAVTRRRPPRPRWLRWLPVLSGLALAVLVAGAAALLVILVRGRTVFYLGDLRVRITNLSNLLDGAALALMVLLLVSPRARAFIRGTPGSTVGIFVTLAVLALFLSFGPRIRTRGHGIGEGPYALLMGLVPGLDTLRVPARFAMLVALFLAVLSGLGLAALRRRHARAGTVAALVAGVAVLVEGAAVPIPINQRGYEEGLRPPEAGPVRQGALAPPVYRRVADLPAGTVLVEFPFGAPVYEFRYLFYSTQHWKPLVNGVSGFFPESYLGRSARLRLPALLADPDAAWTALRRAGATHAIVHTQAFIHDEADRVGAWLESHGARLLGTFEYDRLYELPRP